MLLASPVAGTVGVQLVSRIRDIDAATGAAMAASVLVNAVGEELFWRGVFMQELADRRRLAMVWPVIGFAARHLALS
jgi:membrane protease YdiL (CAAX protease family)